MSTVLAIDNSIGWAHWRLRGGWKTTVSICAGYVGVISIAIISTMRLNTTPGTTNADILSYWKMGLLLVQAALMVMFAGGRVANSIRSDITNRMIESHRLMPVAPASAILGYLWGPSAQAAMLACVNFLIGAIVTLAAGMETMTWIGPNLILTGFALFCWIVSAFTASLTKAGPGILVAVIMGSAFSQGMIMFIAPGAYLLFSPMFGKTVFTTSLSHSELSWPIMASVLAQAYFGAVFFVGAARKYRNSEDTALAVVPALMLLIAYVAASGYVMRFWDDLRPTMLARARPDPRVMFFSGICTSLLLSLVAIANCARDRKLRSIAPIIAIASAAVILTLCTLVEIEDIFWPQAVALTAVPLVSFTISLCFLCRIIYRVRPKAQVMATCWIGLTWIVPLAIEYLQWAMAEFPDSYQISPVAGCSLIGLLILIWDPSQGIPLLGLIFHAGCAIGWAMLFYMTQRRREART